MTSAATRNAGPVYRVHGMMQSYFTRKMTGYLDYKGIPWRFRPFGGMSPAALAAGFPGGVPMVETPDGAMMWDSTAMIHHLERRFPEPTVLPDDPVLRFLAYVVEDFSDEWLYRPAVGTRWLFPENAAVAGFELARDIAAVMPLPADQAQLAVGAHVRSSLHALGIDEANVQTWVEDGLRPWVSLFGAHVADQPYLLGGRPSLADFALFGGNVAHFTNDPVCRRWVDADAPAVVAHTTRLLTPEDQPAGDWVDEPPATLVALIREIARTYLPWVTHACTDGMADAVFSDGTRIAIAATPFLRTARGTLLARYRSLRCDRLDSFLDGAGALPFFAGCIETAGEIPDDREPPRPTLNRPFPPAEG
jgi:glutathione S-transferase